MNSGSEDPGVVEIDWRRPDDYPKQKNLNQPMFSVDVLIYDQNDQHTIGWYDYGKKKWHFLCREAIKQFVWRYLIEQIDKP